MVDDHADQPAAKFSASVIAERLREVLDMLDRSDVTPDVGAHVDLALCRLEDQIASSENDNTDLANYEIRPSFS